MRMLFNLRRFRDNALKKPHDMLVIFKIKFLQLLKSGI